MKLNIEFDTENENDSEQLKVFFASHDIERFLDKVHNEFRKITKHDSLQLDDKQLEAVEKVIEKYYDVLHEYNLGELL